MLLLARDDVEDVVAALAHRGIRLTHHVDRHVDQLGHDVALRPESVGMSNGASHDAPQHVAAVVVRREDFVADEHGARSGVLGQHAQGERVGVVVVADDIVGAGDAPSAIDQRSHEVGLPHRLHTLEKAEDPFEAGTGVDRRLRERRSRPVLRLVELHEHEVPELEEPRLGRRVEGTTFGAVFRAAVDVDLAARSARARRTHLPEVVLVAEPLDARLGHLGEIKPQRLRLVVGLMHRDPQLLRIEAEGARGEIPRIGDGLRLEVVTEAEVAEHLEEHKMARGAANVVEVVVLASGPGALLAGGGPFERCRLIAGEVRLERNHAGNREQQRRIVRDQAPRRNLLVAAGDEVIQETPAELVGGLRRR